MYSEFLYLFIKLSAILLSFTLSYYIINLSLGKENIDWKASAFLLIGIFILLFTVFEWI